MEVKRLEREDGRKSEDKEEYDSDERLIADSCYDSFYSYKNYDTEKEKGIKERWRRKGGDDEEMAKKKLIMEEEK